MSSVFWYALAGSKYENTYVSGLMTKLQYDKIMELPDGLEKFYSYKGLEKREDWYKTWFVYDCTFTVVTDSEIEFLKRCGVLDEDDINDDRHYDELLVSFVEQEVLEN